MAGKNQKLRGATGLQPHNRVEELRRMRGLSQTELANLCNMGKSSIARIEALETGMDISDMRAISRALKVKPSELMVEQDVECRLDADARAALDGLGAAEINMVMQAASSIAKLVKRLSPTHGAASLMGDSVVTTRMADMWNEMDKQDQARTLGLVETARAFSSPQRLMAAE